MTLETATLLLVSATVGLVLATLGLVFVAYRALKSQERATKLQADLQTRSIEAQLGVVEEMRKEALERNPLNVSVAQVDSVAGIFKVDLINKGSDISVAIEHMRFEQLGTDMPPYDTDAMIRLGAGEQYRFEYPYRPGEAGTELLLTITGHPDGGQVQDRRYLFRVESDGTLTDLQLSQTALFQAMMEASRRRRI